MLGIRIALDHGLARTDALSRAVTLFYPRIGTVDFDQHYPPPEGREFERASQLGACSVSVRKHFESFESFVIQSGDLIREGHHRCGRRRTADVTTAANCDIRVT